MECDIFPIHPRYAKTQNMVACSYNKFDFLLLTAGQNDKCLKKNSKFFHMVFSMYLMVPYSLETCIYRDFSTYLF